MKNGKKRLLSLLFALSLLLTCLPQTTLPVKALGETSGECGDNLEWSLDIGEHVLTITGSGEMNDYDDWSDYTRPPWYVMKEAIETVMLPDGLESIGDCAFDDCEYLSNVRIPDGVKHIGSCAFSDCNSLLSITIPSSVKEIGGGAFHNCQNLAHATIPEGVMSIGGTAFGSCANLSGITIPDSVKEIGEGAFSYTEDYNNETNWTTGQLGYGYFMIDHWLLAIGHSIDLDDPLIPDGTKGISSGVFNEMYLGERIWDITIPSSVRYISSNAFQDFRKVSKIIIPEGVTYIGGSQEQTLGTGCDSLEEIQVASGNAYYSSDSGILFNKNKTELIQCPPQKKGDYQIPNTVTCIDNYAFYGCEGLTSITLPDGVTSIGDYAFQNCTGLTEITLPNGVTSIGDYAFQNCTGLTEITLPDSTERIGDRAFLNCENLAMITLPNNVKEIAAGAFGRTAYCDNEENWTAQLLYLNNWLIDSKGDISEAKIRPGTVGIADGACSGCKNLTDLEIPEGVKYIGSKAFFNCDSLLRVTIPSTVINIGEDAFSWCSHMKSIAILNPNCVINGGEETMGDLWNTYINGYQNSTAEAYAAKYGYSFNYLTYDSCADGHDFGPWTQTSAATCTEDGQESRTCSRCGQIETRVASPALGHAWDEGKVTLEPTETTQGERTYTCTRCGKTDVRSIPKTTDIREIDVKLYGSDSDTGETETIELVTAGIASYNLPQGIMYDQASQTLSLHNYKNTSYKLIIMFGMSCEEETFTLRLSGDNLLDSIHAGSYWGSVMSEPRNWFHITGDGSLTTGQVNCTWLVMDSGTLNIVQNQEYMPQYALFSYHYGDLKGSPPSCYRFLGGEVNINCSADLGDRQFVGMDVESGNVEIRNAKVRINLGNNEWLGLGVGWTGKNRNGGTLTMENSTLEIISAGNQVYFNELVNEGDPLHFFVGRNGPENAVKFEEAFEKENGEVSGEELVRYSCSTEGKGYLLITSRDEDTPNFVDVPKGAFYETPVGWAVEKGITNGVKDHYFAPDATCTRGQVVTFLWRANGSPEPASVETAFTDVSNTAFYTKAVAWAVENKITSGMDKTHFGPDAGCTRGQVVTFLWRASGCPEPESTDNPFSDVKDGAFYYKAVLWAVEQGITNGMTKTSFAPDATCTRGQIVTFLYRAMGE